MKVEQTQQLSSVLRRSNTFIIALQAFIVLACVAAASGSPVSPPVYGAPAYHQPSYDEPAVYSYQYGVNDDYSGAK